jgi:hypothetical protein
MISPTEDPISPQLLTVEKRIEDYSNAAVERSSIELKLFTQELEENIMDPYGDKYGYIAYKRGPIEFDNPYIYSIIIGVTAGIPLIFGMPFANPKAKVEVELRVLNQDNTLIGKYSATGVGTATGALFYGYGMGDAFQKANFEALKDAYNKIRPQIQEEVERLNKALKESGKL